MSTKCTISGIDLKTTIGGEDFHANIHAYEECFDETPAPVQIEFWVQGVFNNQEITLTVPADQFRAFAHALGKWADSRDAWEKSQAAEGDDNG